MFFIYDPYPDLNLNEKINHMFHTSQIYDHDSEKVTINGIPYILPQHRFLEICALAVCLSEGVRKMEDDGDLDEQIFVTFGHMRNRRAQTLTLLCDGLKHKSPDEDEDVTQFLTHRDCFNIVCDAIQHSLSHDTGNRHFYRKMASILVKALSVRTIQRQMQMLVGFRGNRYDHGVT